MKTTKMSKSELYERSYNKIWSKMLYARQNVHKYEEMLKHYDGTESISEGTIQTCIDAGKRDLKVWSHILQLIETTD